MRRCTLFFVALTVLIWPVVGIAEQAAEATDQVAEAMEVEPSSGSMEAMAPDATPDGVADGADAPAELGWEQFDDPDFDPTAASAPSDISVTAKAASVGTVSSGIVLGPEGVDDQGRKGRLHTVATGDTLWDLSAAYLGTPWVWPSVWTDNGDIDNPHFILPGDKIWITANEMRVVSDAEAESFLAPSTEVAATPDEGLPSDAFEEMEAAPVAAFEEDEPSTMEALPVAVPGQTGQGVDVGRQVTVSRRDAMGFLSADDVAGSTTIVDSPVERTYLAEGDPVYLGMGEGEVEVGDQFTIFEVVEEIRDIETNRLLGHHVETLGWAEVKQLTGDTSIGEIRMSYTEIPRGARVTPRPPAPRSVTVRSTPEAIEGQVVFLPFHRTLMADGGYVYLNRGEFHGVEPGSELEIFESGEIVNERTRRVDVRTPDHVVAKLVVVTVELESSVAFVLSADRELEVGDTVRPVMPELAQR